MNRYLLNILGVAVIIIMTVITNPSYDGQKALSSIGGGLSFEVDKNRILGRDNNSLPRLVIESNNDKFNMKISQPQKNVLTAPNDDMIFNSDDNIHKIIDIIDIDVTLNRTSSGLTWYASNSVPHGLDFTPAYSAFIDIPSAITVISNTPYNNFPNPAMVFGLVGNDLTIFTLVNVSVTDKDVIMEVQTGSAYSPGTYVFNAKVYIYQETAL